MKKKILLPIILVLVGLGAWWIFRSKAPANGNLTLYGNVDIREVNLGFRVPGRIASVLRDEGDAVKTGDFVARLDDEPFRRAVEQARGQLASAEAKLKMVQTGYRPQEIAQARAVVREREVTLANDERLFKRQQDLLNNRAVSIQDRDDAEARFRESDARLKSAQEQLQLLESGFRSEDVEQAKGDVERYRAALQTSEIQLTDTVLKAPSDGVILTRAQEPGAIVSAGSTVLTESLTNTVWVRAYIHEPDLGKIHPGSKVEVYTDSRPKQPYPGTVGFISPRAEFTPKSVETSELRTSLVFRLRITVTQPDEGLRQGMPVTIKVLAE